MRTLHPHPAGPDAGRRAAGAGGRQSRRRRSARRQTRGQAHARRGQGVRRRASTTTSSGCRSKQSTAEWIKNTYITDDTERNAAAANEELMALHRRAPSRRRARFAGVEARPRHRAHAATCCASSSSLPAPERRRSAPELATLAREAGGHLRQGQVRAAPTARRNVPRPRELLETCSRRAATTTSCSTPGRAGTRIARADAAAVHALRRARQRGRARRSASPTSASCGAPATTCRRPSSRRRPSGCGSRSSRSTTSCTATCARSSRKTYGKDKVPDDGPDPGAPARQHVGAGVGQHLPAGRAVQGAGQPRRHRAR